MFIGYRRWSFDWWAGVYLLVDTPRRLLLTGGRSPATLALLRLLYGDGHRVYVAESLPHNLAGASRYCAGNFRVPPPAQATEAFIQALGDICRREHIDMLIPTCEEIFYIARWKHQLEQVCEVFCPTIDVLTNLHSKYQFMQLLKALKIPAPATQQITSSAELAMALAERETYVLKPEFSRFSNFVLINRPVEEALAKAQPDPARPWVLQEYLQGDAYCSYSVARNGRLLAHAVYPSRYTAGLGATLYFEGVQVPAIEKIVSKLVESLDYTGQISFDFICRDGIYYPIECNPRTTSGTCLFAAQDHLARAFWERDLPLIRGVGNPPVMIGAAMLLYMLPRIRSWQQLQLLMRDMLAAEDGLFQLADLGPAIAQFRSFGYFGRVARKARMSLLAATTHDIEWNGEAA